MTAIQTHFIGPTNVRGSRIKAVALGTRQAITLHWDHALDATDNHRRAAIVLADKYRWIGTWVEGNGQDGASIFVCLTRAAVNDQFTIEARNDE